VPSDLLSLAAASQLLGVSSERVRQLVVAGDIPAVRFGNAWAVPRDAVAARGQASNRRGRPLGQKGAWRAIVSGDVDLSNVSRYRNRGEVGRYSMSAADVAHLIIEHGAIESGVAAATFHGQLLQTGGADVDLYVSQQVRQVLDSVVAAVDDPLGSVVLRVVSDDVWPGVEIAAAKSDHGRAVAPPGAVALDLMESGDARHWVAAENLVKANV